MFQECIQNLPFSRLVALTACQFVSFSVAGVALVRLIFLFHGRSESFNADYGGCAAVVVWGVAGRCILTSQGGSSCFKLELVRC